MISIDQKKSTIVWTFFIPFISAAITAAVVISCHDIVVTIFLEIGLSHTGAYFSPYVILLICGVVMTTLSKRIARRSLRVFAAFLLLIVPFLTGFAIHPIYEDAIYIGGTEYGYHHDALSENHKFSIIVIPDCPFCKMAIQQSGRFVSVEENSFVEVVLCSSDSAATAKYKNILPKGVQLRNASDPDSVAVYTVGSFPAYCARISDDKMRVWSNNEFGPRALDCIESK